MAQAQRTGVRRGAAGKSLGSASSLLQWCHHFIPSHGTAVNQRADSEMVDRFVRSRRMGLLNKAGHPPEKRRGRHESRARGLTGAQTRISRADCGEAALAVNAWLC